MKKTMKTIFAVMIIAATFTSCAKDGETGPAGPAGTNGNANVVASNTVTLNNWISIFDDGTNYLFESTVSWAGITQAIKDNGAVMVYMYDGVSNWYALPYSDDGDTYSENFNYSFTVGQVVIEVNGWDATLSPNPSDYNGAVVRIVAIAASVRVANPDVDWTDYNQVKTVLNLKD